MRIGAGRWKNARLPTAGEDVRPVPARLRTSLFSILHARVEGAVVLDLCAGVGGFGLEALSRGAARVVLVDVDRKTVAALARWIAERGVEREARAVLGDARRGGWPPDEYDLAFVDPPFPAWEGDDARAMLERAAASLARGGLLVAKVPAKAVTPVVAGLSERDRRAQGTVAFVLWERTEA